MIYICVCMQGGYVCRTYPKYKIATLNVHRKFFSLEFLACCRPARYPLQLREQLSTSLADVLRHSPPFGKDIPWPNFHFTLRVGGGGVRVDGKE